jgi:hypothetical protein
MVLNSLWYHWICSRPSGHCQPYPGTPIERNRRRRSSTTALADARAPLPAHRCPLLHRQWRSATHDRGRRKCSPAPLDHPHDPDAYCPRRRPRRRRVHARHCAHAPSSITACNSLLAAHFRRGPSDAALRLFRAFPPAARPDSTTFTLCARLGDLSTGEVVKISASDAGYRNSIFVCSSLLVCRQGVPQNAEEGPHHLEHHGFWVFARRAAGRGD